MGPWFRRLGRGVDSSPVDASPYVPRGHGRETTFQHDLTDWAQVRQEVRRLAARVLEDIRAEGRPAVRVGLKLRYAPFETRSRSLTLPGPTFDEAQVAGAAVELLDRLDATRAVRLVGVRLEMAPPAGG
jgi:DNA polymerase-4